jgi:hypothetical protein
VPGVAASRLYLPGGMWRIQVAIRHAVAQHNLVLAVLRASTS